MQMSPGASSAALDEHRAVLGLELGEQAGQAVML